MSGKLVTIFVVLCFYGLANAKEAGVVDSSQTDINDAYDLLKGLKNVIDQSISEAQKSLDSASQKLKSVARENEDNADSQMNKNNSELLKKLGKLKAKANLKHKDISKCLGKQEAKLNDLPTEYQSKVKKCQSQLLDDGSKSYNKALTKITSSKDKLPYYNQEIQKCKKSAKNGKCLAKVSDKLKKDTVQVPKSILSNTNTAISAMTKLQPNLVKCASSEARKCVSKENELFKQISNCISSKIG